MKYIKPLILLSIISAVLLSLFFLFRRTNILLTSVNNLRNDLKSIKNQNLVSTSEREPFVNPTQNEQEHTQFDQIVNESTRLESTRQNIDNLKNSIEKLEDMISTSSGDDDELDSEQTSWSLSSTGDENTIVQLDEDGDDEENIIQDLEDNNEHLEKDEPKNLLSYDLADTGEKNSELEILLVEPKDVDETLSIDMNKEGNLQKDMVDQVKIDVILNSYSKRNLEKLCGDNKLSKSGSKTILIKRLLNSGYEFTNVTQETDKILSQN